jgi:hypothetical protein
MNPMKTTLTVNKQTRLIEARTALCGDRLLKSSQSMWRVARVCLLASLIGSSASAQTHTQSFTLQPGWNAVYVEVEPADNSTDALFAGLPVASVWTPAERASSADFIQDPSEAVFNEAGWLGWYHPSRPDAFLGNLFALHANRAYLIRITNSSPVNWAITGRPSLRHQDWVPDAYSLRGLPVDPDALPTFANFFRPSPAHYDAATGQLENIYRLGASGQWELAAPSDTIRSGEAYWIQTRGASDYLAPLKVAVDLGDGLDYGLELTELSVGVANTTGGSMNVMVRDMGTNPTPLSHYTFDPSLGGQWPTLPAPLALSPGPLSEIRLRLAIRRQDINAATFGSILSIRDGAGTRFLIPVNAEKFTGAPAGTLPALQGRPRPHAPIDDAKALAGLWIGSATLNAVSEAHSSDPTVVTPVKSEMNLRLIVHVDDAGQARLLKEVIQMWRDGTFTNNVDGDQVVDKPGEYVLLTDDSLIPRFEGAGLRDGEPVGRRTSTMGYDFPADAGNNFLNLSGFFAIGQSLTGALEISHDHPTNPFRHKFHPDHDNLNERFDGPAVEAFTPTRQVRLEFAASPPEGPDVPDFGYNAMGGTYRETITGIHKNPIHVSGTFRLTRVSLIAQLNPSPTP